MNLPQASNPRSLSRRQFLRRSAVLAATAGPALSIARGAHAAGSDVLRIGMVGCGGRCSGAAMEQMRADPGVRLVAMADLFADRVKSKRELLRKQRPNQVAVDDNHMFIGLDGYKKVIESVDIVLIACAAKFHPMYLKAGIEAGKHVFVEKPHAIDPAGIQVVRKACELAKEKNVGVLSGLHSRFQPSVCETIQRVHDGQIGEIIAIEENFLRGPYGCIQHPKVGREIEAQYGNQYRFAWLGGDDVTQSLVHNLDRAMWVLKETTPVDCHGLGGRSGVQNLLGDVFDHQSVVYRYASGVRVYAFTRTTFGCYDEYSSFILGSKGTANVMAGRITGEKPWKFSGSREDPHYLEQVEFLKSIRAGRPINCGAYMAPSTLVAIMGQLSCYSGKGIAWNDIVKSQFCLMPRPEDCTWDMDPPTKPDSSGVYPVCAMPGITKIL